MEIDKKCAPGKTYDNGSCFTLEALQKIAKNYNKQPSTTHKIDISDDKEQLVKDLESKLSNKCDSQACWLRLNIVTELKDENIEQYTFRPEGPKKQFEWLSTSDINDVVLQYQEKYNDFVFFGAVPADFYDLKVLGIGNLDFNDMVKEGKTRGGLVINLDEHWKNGSHWVALFFDLVKYQIYYFDSYGKKPYKRTKKFINKILKFFYKSKFKKSLNINKLITSLNEDSHTFTDKLKKFDIKYNKIQHQFNNSECGVYSMNFIIRLLHGETFTEITENITKDKDMNKCRSAYFINVDIK